VADLPREPEFVPETLDGLPVRRDLGLEELEGDLSPGLLVVNMPPLPSSSITSYRPAKVVPVRRSVRIVARVSVKTGASGQASGAAQLPQNFVSAGFSWAHLGHFILGVRDLDIAVPALRTLHGLVLNMKLTSAGPEHTHSAGKKQEN
jgi:hypothetical protein